MRGEMFSGGTRVLRSRGLAVQSLGDGGVNVLTGGHGLAPGNFDRVGPQDLAEEQAASFRSGDLLQIGGLSDAKDQIDGQVYRERSAGESPGENLTILQREGRFRTENAHGYLW